MEELPDGALLALFGFGGGLALGLAARLGRFCTLGAIEDWLYGGDARRLRMWGLALGLSIVFAHLSMAADILRPESSIYYAFAWSPAGGIVGGLMFGYGMALAGNCGYGALARLGGGDLRSFVIVIVIGLAAYATIGGPLAFLRSTMFPTVLASDQATGGVAHDLGAALGVPSVAIGVIIGLVISMIALSGKWFRRDLKALSWSVVVAAAILSGWIGTSFVTERSFEAFRSGSHSFTAPLGETILYLMTSSAGGVSFGIGSVAGVLVGAFIGSVRKGHFRWEACDDPRELGRQILGGALMGVGGVTAMGCSVGQGLTAFSVLTWSAPITLCAIMIGGAIGLRQLIEGFRPVERR